jgi:phosphohistidine phosphatase
MVETKMDLLLWRSAETVKLDEAEATDSLKTPLSERGRKQAMRVASWLHEHASKELKVFASPAMATIEMAKAVSRHATVDRRLGPDAGAGDLLSAVGWPHDHPAVLVIAHQPALGGLASLLLAGAEAPWTIKKGALWWFSNRTRAGESQTVLRAVLSPDLIKSGAARSAEPATAASFVPARLLPRVEDLVLGNSLGLR